MKLVMVFFVLIGSVEMVSAQKATLHVDNATYKFPPTQQGVLLEHSYIITNTGNAPLIISDYTVNCTCTKLSLPKRPIAPGESFPIKVTFDTAGKYYYQDRTIGLVTNTNKKHSLRFKVKVIPKK
jgi:hypothetical protein